MTFEKLVPSMDDGISSVSNIHNDQESSDKQ